MGQKSKAAWQKAAGIANACTFCHSESRILELIPDAKMNDTKITKTSKSLGLSDLENEANNEWMILEGPRDSPLGSETSWDDFDLLEAKITQFDSAPYRSGNTGWSGVAVQGPIATWFYIYICRLQMLYIHSLTSSSLLALLQDSPQALCLL